MAKKSTIKGLDEKSTPASTVKALYQKANDGFRKNWQYKARKNRDFFNNEQITEDERKALDASGMPDFIINRITPVVEMMSYFVTESTPRWQAVGRDGSDSELAHIHSTVAEYTWNLSNGQSLYGQITQDAFVEGVGYFHVDIDPNMDRGRGEVILKRISPYDIYVDTSSTDPLFRDASYMIVKKDIPRSHLVNALPMYKDKIMKSSGENERNRGLSERALGGDIFSASDIFYTEDVSYAYDIDANEDQILDYYEMYHKVPVEFVNVFIKEPPSPEQIEQIKKDISVQIKEMEMEFAVRLKEQETEYNKLIKEEKMIPERAELELRRAQENMQQQLQQAQQQAFSQAIQEATTVTENMVTKEEFKILAEEEEFMANVEDAMPFFEDRVMVRASIGSNTFLYDRQLPIKDYPIVPICYIHTGTPLPLSAVSMLRGKQEEINKSHQILIHNASLGSSLRFTFEEGAIDTKYWEQYSSAPGALLPHNPGFNPPTVIQPFQLSNAFFGIVQTGESEMEYMSGVYSSMQGNVSAQHETFKGLLANDEYGTRRIRAWMNKVVKPALAHLGKVHLDLCQKTYSAHKVFRLVQPDNTVVKEINVPIYDDYGEEVDRYNDYQSAQMDVILVGGATTPVNRWALRQEYFRWYEAGIIDDIAFLAETDVKDKEGIAERKSNLSEAYGQVESLQEAIKNRDGTIETLQRQIVQSEIKNEILKANTEIQKAKIEAEADIETTSEIEQAKQKLETQKVKEGNKEKSKESKKST